MNAADIAKALGACRTGGQPIAVFPNYEDSTPSQSHKRDFLPCSPLRGRKNSSREHNPLARFNPLRDGRKAAIEAMCAACMGCTPEEAEPGFKRAISECTSKQCPLWTFRPYQPAGEEL